MEWCAIAEAVLDTLTAHIFPGLLQLGQKLRGPAPPLPVFHFRAENSQAVHVRLDLQYLVSKSSGDELVILHGFNF